MSGEKQDKVSFYKFFQRFPDEVSAEKYFAEKRWGKDGKDRFCPHCGSVRTVTTKDKMPYRCKDCRKRFSVRTKSILAESNISLHKWLMAVYLLNTNLKGVSRHEACQGFGHTAEIGVVPCSQDKRIYEREGESFHFPDRGGRNIHRGSRQESA